jgi:hypothetical protein
MTKDNYRKKNANCIKTADSGSYHSGKIHIVTGLINALPGNSPVNTGQHATIEEVVFSVSAVMSQP